MDIDIEKYLKDKGLFKTVVEDYNPYIVADLMEMYAKKYHEDQLNNLSQHLVSKRFCLCKEPDENWDSGQTCFCGKCDKLVNAC